MFGLNWTFKSSPDQMLPDVGFGPTTWTYHLGLYFAPWNRFQPYLVLNRFMLEISFYSRLEFSLDTFSTTHVES